MNAQKVLERFFEDNLINRNMRIFSSRVNRELYIQYKRKQYLNEIKDILKVDVYNLKENTPFLFNKQEEPFNSTQHHSTEPPRKRWESLNKLVYSDPEPFGKTTIMYTNNTMITTRELKSAFAKEPREYKTSSSTFVSIKTVDNPEYFEHNYMKEYKQNGNELVEDYESDTEDDVKEKSYKEFEECVQEKFASLTPDSLFSMIVSANPNLLNTILNSRDGTINLAVVKAIYNGISLANEYINLAAGYLIEEYGPCRSETQSTSSKPHTNIAVNINQKDGNNQKFTYLLPFPFGTHGGPNYEGDEPPVSRVTNVSGFDNINEDDYNNGGNTMNEMLQQVMNIEALKKAKELTETLKHTINPADLKDLQKTLAKQIQTMKQQQEYSNQYGTSTIEYYVEEDTQSYISTDSSSFDSSDDDENNTIQYTVHNTIVDTDNHITKPKKEHTSSNHMYATPIKEAPLPYGDEKDPAIEYDPLFWYHYFFTNGIEEYKKHAQNYKEFERSERERYVEIFKKKHEYYKDKKNNMFHFEEAIKNLIMYDEPITYNTLLCLCRVTHINICIVYNKVGAFVFNHPSDLYFFILENGKYIQQKYSIQHLNNEFYIVDDLLLPYHPMTYYRVPHLIDLFNELNIDLCDKDGKKLKKKDMYQRMKVEMKKLLMPFYNRWGSPIEWIHEIDDT